MKYEVRCECGQAHAVSAADAGSALRCACGRSVEVPSLHALRTAGGAGAVSPLARIRTALLSGLLPGTRACASCRTDTNDRCRVKVLCEVTPNQGGASPAEKLGCILFPYLGWFVALSLVMGLRSQRKRAGDEEAVIVPLPICAGCRPKLVEPNVLRTAVRRVPDYAALLDHYPAAQTDIAN